MTGSFRGEGKTDAKDAKVIANSARLREDLNQVVMPDELVVGRTQLTSYRTDLMSDWVAGINRLRALLGSIFPRAGSRVRLLEPDPADPRRRTVLPRRASSGWNDGATTHLTDNGAWRPGIAKAAATALELSDAKALPCPARPTPRC
jgi:hypothetical protein